jgi:hypothetical protein
MSDGQGANDNYENLMKKIMANFGGGDKGLILNGVAFGTESSYSMLENLAKIGNGSFFNCKDLNDLIESYKNISNCLKK